MLRRVIDISESPCYIHVERGFLVISATSKDQGGEIGRTPLDDLAAVVVTSPSAVVSHRALSALSERGVPYVICSVGHSPTGVLWPLEANFELAKRMESQIGAKLPLRKTLWSQVVREKIRSQAATLRRWDQPAVHLNRLATLVRSGDPTNIEAQAARSYWTALFGSQFRRDRNQPGANSLLNYGYAIIRSAVCRAIAAAGLHPALGIHHSHDNNAFRLADDLMEPFRPLVDHTVKGLGVQGIDEVDRKSKSALGGVLFQSLSSAGKETRVIVAIQEAVDSLVKCYLGQAKDLRFPDWDTFGSANYGDGVSTDVDDCDV